MRLAKAKFEKVGPFKDFSIEFKKNKKKNLAEVHILTGPNGSGKSTILKGLSYAFQGPSRMPENFIDLFWTSGDNGSGIDVFDRQDDGVYIASSGPHSGFRVVNSAMRDAEVSFNKYSKQIQSYRRTDKETEIPFAAFAYSGHRFLNTNRDDFQTSASVSSNTSHYRSNPFDQAINFERNQADSLPISDWIYEILSKSAFAHQSGDKILEKASRSTLDKLETIIREITERDFRFNVDYEVLIVNSKLSGREVGFNVLPDGFKSILSWLSDLIIRMERIRWKEKKSIFEQPIILFLDEIDIHLHPSWQMKILPIIQKTFVNAQIFVSTHSPFVVASVEDAYVYDLNIDKDGFSYLEQSPMLTERGQSYIRVLQEVFDIEGEFVDQWSTENLKEFKLLLEKTKSKNSKAYKDAQAIGKKLASENVELRDIVSISLKQLERRVSKPIA